MTKVPHPVDVHVGKRLRTLRCLAGLSQVELAGSVAITFQQLQKYESGANRVSASRLWEFAQVLHAPVESFFPSPNVDTGDLPPIDDPAFLQWMRLYRDTPEEGRRLLSKLAKVLVQERLSPAAGDTHRLCSRVDD
jgi:transcriptional regulator with XRE-family HTH domain